jgi:hypothetical protein
MDHASIIDQALAQAQARLNAGASAPTSKTASAPRSATAGIKKEASDLAGALEYLALKVADDGTAQGAISAEMTRQFFKKANEPKTPISGPTLASGTQAIPPNHGRTTLSASTSGSMETPAVSESPNGEMKRSVMEQKAPEVKKANLTLYDILKQAQDGKTAGAGGPAEMTADQPAPGIPTGNENRNRHSLLDSAEAVRNATKREAKAPGRARIAELFSSASDTTGMAGAQAAFPGAAAKGGLKVASLARAYAEHRKTGSSPALEVLGKLAEKEEKEEKGEKNEHEEKESPAKEKKEGKESPAHEKKEGSVGEYSNLWDMAISGQLGEEVLSAAQQLAQQVAG